MFYIFVEGYFDEYYFTRIFFASTLVCFIQYASLKPEKVNDYLKSIKKIPNSDYLFFGDSDGLSINEKTDFLITKYKEIDHHKVFIVQYEIESWYYAGVCESDCKKLRLTKFEYSTNSLTKEGLDAKMPKPSERAVILSKLIELYSIELAEMRNDSLKLFIDYIRNNCFESE